MAKKETEIQRHETPINVEALSQLILGGNLAQLKPDQKVQYYKHVCELIGVNPTTKPFDYIVLNGKEVLYANKGCCEQLRAVHKISIRVVSREKIDDVYVVTAEASDTHGRVDSSTGAVPCKNLQGEALANAMMKAETKAKRRVTLSICSLNMLDEIEVQSIPNASHPAEEKPLGELQGLTPSLPQSQAPTSDLKNAEGKSRSETQPSQKTTTSKSPSASSSAAGTQATQSSSTPAVATRPRAELNVIIMGIYKPYLAKFPETKFFDLLKERYGVPETRLMKDNQLEDLIALMESRLGVLGEPVTNGAGDVKPKTVLPDTKPAKAAMERLVAIQTKRKAEWSSSKVTQYINKAFGKTSSKDLSAHEVAMLTGVIERAAFSEAMKEQEDFK